MQDQTKAAAEPSPSTGRFVEGVTGTIIDRKKKLMWLRQDTWQMTGKWMNWVQVRDYAEELNSSKFGGFSNWRMPTAAEAKSLYDKSQSNKDHQGKAISVHEIFEPGFGFLCWTSDVRNKVQAVRVGFRKGVLTYDDIYRPSRGSARLVRDIERGETIP